MKILDIIRLTNATPLKFKDIVWGKTIVQYKADVQCIVPPKGFGVIKASSIHGNIEWAYVDFGGIIYTCAVTNFMQV